MELSNENKRKYSLVAMHFDAIHHCELKVLQIITSVSTCIFCKKLRILASTESFLLLPTFEGFLRVSFEFNNNVRVHMLFPKQVKLRWRYAENILEGGIN